jgi:hypothetical protein
VQLERHPETGQALVDNPNIGRQNYILGRMDYQVSEKSSVFFRYVLDRAQRDFTNNIPYWAELDRTRDHFVNIEERHVLTPRLVNSVHAGFARTYEDAYHLRQSGCFKWSLQCRAESQRLSPPKKTTPGIHPLQFFSGDASSQFYAVSTSRPGH